MAPNRRARQRLLATAALATACSSVKLLAAFVGSPTSKGLPALRTGGVSRRAEEEKKEDEGFMKFLKVEQDIELSPEEFAMALEQEIESQRKRYYIGGVVKENNLIVPWRPVNEKQLDKDARRMLKKNGIIDPNKDTSEDEEDSPIDVNIVGGEDVQIDWTAGEPGTKVGYIVEKKRAKDTNFREIASYEQARFAYLLAKPYAGEEYSHSDELVPPGAWTYRVLCRFRSGEIQVLDQKDITVPEVGGIPNQLAFGALGITWILLAIYGFSVDPPVGE